MGVWYHHITTEDKPVTLEEIGLALAQANRKFYLDDNLILKKPSEDAEPDYSDDSQDWECGLITFEAFDEQGLTEEYDSLLHERAADKSSRDKIMRYFRRAKHAILIQVLNYGGGDTYDESIEPLWDWLIENREGVLATDDGEFYDKSGAID
jgi:hypothetical protein